MGVEDRPGKPRIVGSTELHETDEFRRYKEHMQARYSLIEYAKVTLGPKVRAVRKRLRLG